MKRQNKQTTKIKLKTKMDNEEMEELFGQLRTAGYTPMPYETDIPTYTNRVHCGPATEVGDTNQENDDWYSQDMIERNRKFRIPAIGDSMQDAPVRGKRFRDYVMIADRTEELLMAA